MLVAESCGVACLYCKRSAIAWVYSIVNCHCAHSCCWYAHIPGCIPLQEFSHEPSTHNEALPLLGFFFALCSLFQALAPTLLFTPDLSRISPLRDTCSEHVETAPDS